MKRIFLLNCLFLAMPSLAQNPTGSGPERAIVYSDSALPTHTIYRPESVSGNYPVVLWGNGSCRNDNTNYREFLAEVASHGFLVLAIGPYLNSPAPRASRPESPADWPPDETHFSLHFDALDWIENENTRDDSPYYGMADMDNIAVMGHSCGGLQAVNASSDPRITTTVVLNSGLFEDDDVYMQRHDAKRAQLLNLHSTVAYFIGGETDIAYPQAEKDWADLKTQNMPAIIANMDVGHGATYSQPGGYPFAEGPIAWLKFQLQDDEHAEAMFTGENCGLCKSTDWNYRRHGL